MPDRQIDRHNNFILHHIPLDDDDGGDDDDDDSGGDDDDYDDDDGDGLCDIDQILMISRTPKEDPALFSQSAK